jgi:bifunctional non-homologous end joining protein LigD
MKVYKEEDLIICGYTPSEYGMKDVILGAYNENNDLYKVATIMTNKDKNIIMEYAKRYPSKPLFAGDGIIWMKPNLVGRVKFMMKTKDGNLRQASFLGVRDDKVASDLKGK